MTDFEPFLFRIKDAAKALSLGVAAPQFKLHYRIDEMVPERALPPDWEEINSDGYSKEAALYYVSTDPERDKMNRAIDARIAQQIVERGYNSILDVGVGDGIRLKRIKEKVKERNQASSLKLYGTDVSSPMIEIARANGVEVVEHNMRQPLPTFAAPLDVITFLSGNFGYIMDLDPVKAETLRVNALNSVYERLSDKGMAVLEMITLDPKQSQEEVSHFTRKLYKKNIEETDYPEVEHFIRTFSLKEFQSLLDKTRFDKSKAKFEYIERSGKNIGQSVNPDRLKQTNKSYRLFVTLNK